MIGKLQRWLFIVFLVLTPIVYSTTGASLRATQEQFFQIVGMCLIATFIGNIWITLFIILNFALFLYHGGTVGQSTAINVFIGGLLFLISRKYWQINNTDPLFRCIAFIGIATIVWMSLQLMKIDPIFIAQDAGSVPVHGIPFQNPIGLFGIKMANGIFLTLVTLVVASINLWLTPLMLVPLFMAQSSAVALSLFSSLSFYLYFMHRKLFIPFIAIGLIGLGTYMVIDERSDSQTFVSRFPVWHSAVKYAFLNPIGFGPDSYRNLNKHKNFIFKSDEKYNHGIETYRGDEVTFQYYSMIGSQAEVETLTKNKVESGFELKDFCLWDNPHNEYIQLFFEYGVIGIILLIGLIREMWYRFRFFPGKRDKELILITSCLIVYFVSGFTQFPLHLTRLAYLFPIFLGAFYSRTDYAT